MTTQEFVQRQKRKDQIFRYTSLSLLVFALLILGVLLGSLAGSGVSRLSLDFFSHFPSRFADQAGILSAWVGTLCVMAVTAIAAIPLGVAAGVYLEEYAAKNRLTAFIEINITNLAGVPSIVFGLMALGIFVYAFGFGQSVLTAGLTLGLLVLPIIIVATREALRTVPQEIREAAFAMGATRWQVIQHHLLPYSTGGILTGAIIALSRAIGETAPLITIGALTFIAFLPSSPITVNAPFVSFQWLFDSFTVVPIQMFNWVSRPQEEFHVNAAAAGLILLVITLMLNSTAIWLRYRFRKKISW